MLTLKHVGYALLAALFVTAIAVDAADARGGGGGARGGGMRAGGLGGGSRVAHIGGPRPSHPIAGRPGGPGGPGRPDWGRPGRPGWGGGSGNWGGGNWGGYWPGYGVGIGLGALGAGLAYSNWCDPYYNNGCYDYGYQGTGYQDGYQDNDVAYCAQRFRSYDVASQTYLAKSGKRVRCP